MGFHPDCLQDIKEKMGIHLVGQHIEFDIPLLNLQLFFFQFNLVVFGQEPFDALHHLVEVFGQLPNLIPAGNGQGIIKIARGNPVGTGL